MGYTKKSKKKKRSKGGTKKRKRSPEPQTTPLISIPYGKLLSIEEIRQKISGFLSKKKDRTLISTSLVLFPSSHGEEGIDCCDSDKLYFPEKSNFYSRIIDNIEINYYKGLDSSFEENKNDLIQYIKKVKFTTAVGPGTCSLMTTSRQTGIDVGYDANYTTSQLDIAIISRVYNVFTNFFPHIKMTNEIDEYLFNLARMQLRYAFVQTWREEKKTSVTRKTLTDINKNNIWKNIKLNEESTDRYYTLETQKDENLELDPKYGVHIINATNNMGEHINSLFAKSSQQTEQNLDETTCFDNNINDYECNNRILQQIQTPPPPTNLFKSLLLLLTRQANNNITITITPDVKGIIESIIDTKETRLSDLIYLGYRLGLDITVFDPSCRPKYSIRHFRDKLKIVEDNNNNADITEGTQNTQNTQNTQDT